MVIADITMTSKGQMTLPKEMREQLHLGSGDKLRAVLQDGRIVLTRKLSLDELCNVLPSPVRKLTLDEIDEAIGAGIAEHHMRPASGPSSSRSK